MEEYAIELENVSKQYDGFLLDKISFKVIKGTVMGFVGQNGSGKTTTIKALLGINKIDEGNIKINGRDILDKELVKGDIGVIFDEIPFQQNLKIYQLQRMLQYFFINWNDEVFLNYIKKFNLPLKKKISELSKGMKMKLQIATCLSHNAKTLIMDEPTTGLDPVVRNEILNEFMDFMLDEDHSILISSHITSDLEKIADSITFIHNGKMLLSDDKNMILENFGIYRCADIKNIPIKEEDIVSIRKNEFGYEVMTRNITSYKSNNIEFDKASLDEIMLFHVKGTASSKEWTL
ncbi:MAG: ABC transporter ATP-binding protein [Erysipelotrichaceae bacterium]|nr:ABC transporter ATP-binding protein [Erysipelotrichaceae bacterium]